MKYNYKIFDIDPKENNGKNKNAILDICINEHYDYCFIKQTDILVIDDSIYDKYCELMDKFKLGIVFYPYYKHYNRLFTKTPNVAVNIKIKDNDYLQLVKQSVKAFIGFNLKVNNHKFNEELRVFDMDEYCKRLADNNLTFGIALYPDVYESWKYFKENSNEALIAQKEDLEFDQKYFENNKIEFKVNYNLDILLKRLIDEFNL